MTSQEEEVKNTQPDARQTMDSSEEQLFEAIANKDLEAVRRLLQQYPDLNLNCVDRDELTPLQHVCHTGHLELTRFLIDNGARVDFTKRKDGYTPLMFAAISAKADIVRLLLERGADITIENCVNRTAAQMAAFVGQSKTVSIINSWVPYESSVEPFTRRRELEDEPRIASRALGQLLHDYIVYPSLHPIKYFLYFKHNLDLIKYGDKVVYVLENLSSKSLKPPCNEESLSLKYYYLAYLIEYSIKTYKSKSDKTSNNDDQFDVASYEKLIDSIIRRLIRRKNPKNIKQYTQQLDKFIVECLMKFPYTQLAIFKTMTFALSKSKAGDTWAYPILTQTILNGSGTLGRTTECCIVCDEQDKNKKCSNCKEVYYCGPVCQQADWFQHKKICQSPEGKPLIKADGEDDQH